MEPVGLDQHPFQIHFAKQQFEYGPLVVLSSGVANLADGYAQRCRVQRHLGDECRTATSGGLDRPPESLAITDQLI